VGGQVRLVQIEAAVDLDLQGVGAPRRAAVVFGGVAAGVGGVCAPPDSPWPPRSRSTLWVSRLAQAAPNRSPSTKSQARSRPPAWAAADGMECQSISHREAVRPVRLGDQALQRCMASTAAFRMRFNNS